MVCRSLRGRLRVQSRNINCTNTIEYRNDSLYTSSSFSNPYSNRACCEQARGHLGQSLSVHHWTEISISIPDIEMEIRTLYVLLEITNVIVSLLPVGFRTPGRQSGFSVTIIKTACVVTFATGLFRVRSISAALYGSSFLGNRCWCRRGINNCINLIEYRNDSLYTSSSFLHPYLNRPCSEQGRGRQGHGLSVHHWTEISISMLKIEIETRTLNVLRRIVTDITVLLPAGSRSPSRPSGFSVMVIKTACVRSH